MSALGQKQTFKGLRAMSALPPKADIGWVPSDVRSVPKADIKAAVVGITVVLSFASKGARTWSASRRRAAGGQ
jgi:hypothetical protein